MRRTNPLVLALVALCATALAVASTTTSDATFTSSSGSRATVSAAADWTPPTVAVTSPGSPLQGTVTLAASASDTESGIASVALQYLAPDATGWVTLCTATAAPYSCSWNTKLGVDGGYDLRARATNTAGYTTVSDVVSTTVANNVLLVLGDPGEVVRGSVALKSTIYNGGLLPWTVTVQYTPNGGTSWKTLCSGLTSPFSCTWSTTSFTNESFDLRAVATSGTTTVTSAVVSDVLVDNAAPGVSMVDPGTPLSGAVNFTATATDAASGVQQVVLQYALGSGSWQNLCTVTTDPFTCRYATTSLTDGTYSFRATATDVAGNSATSTAVTGRVVDNTVSSVSLDDPGTYLSGTATITALANSTAGITSVRIQRAPTGTTSWTDLCTDTTSPYSCAWDTRTVANGSYDLRAVLLDGRGGTTTSAILSARRIDNSTLRAVDVQTTNGNGTAGRLDAGDTVTWTYSEVVAPASISTGWNGSALAVSLRLRDGNLLGGTSKSDAIDVLRGGAAVQLGAVGLREDYVKGRKTATFNATLTATTVTVDGVDRTVVTLVVGTLASGNGLRTVTTASTMLWTPSTAALSATGGACAATPVSESGAADREF
ncbi:MULTISPECIES: Ig-like domain-containing protein [unclassified Nocardioides]|uniref:Ig-like domain-containing protein n=1 Tax=unclassified Nocardioides TaxID=2615069 RepID=UPI000702DDE6|nr:MULTISPECIES: Ig-like domain-containing protein [unclassified Nocardioides]KRC53560.1 signal peptidase I [Nocardioides sp. Root79]KRC67964.1 signal peptidase I [Nocardioides sp. Root240]